MATPMETNTEELQEILNTVYNLPMAGGGSSEPDLIIGLNVANTTSKTPTSSSSEYRYHLEDVSVVSGSVATVVEKLNRNEPVRVLMREINFYGLELWSNGDAEATQVHLVHGGNIYYPDTPVAGLVCNFYTYSIPSVAPNMWGIPVMITITFDVNTGNPAHYAAYPISFGSALT